MGRSVVIYLEPDFDVDAENRSIGELISMLKSSFRDADFARVESVLTAREAKLKKDLEELEQTREWLKRKLDSSRVEKMAVEEELKRECLELRQMNSQLRQEKYEREREAKNEIEFWRRKYEGLETRILKLDADLRLLSSAQPNVRVSSENDNNVGKLEPAFVNMDVVEENVDLARAKEDRTGDGN